MPERSWMPIINSPLKVQMDRLSERQARKNHSQSLDRLAERGGLSPQEVVALMRGERFCHHLTAAEALQEIYYDEPEWAKEREAA